VRLEQEHPPGTSDKAEAKKIIEAKNNVVLILFSGVTAWRLSGIVDM
jgi:hypothetical protein